MPRADFRELPDDARLWVFPVQEPLDEDELAALEDAVRTFLDGWEAHGTPLTGGFTVADGRMVLVAVDQASVPPSGCSIDSMVRVLKGLERSFGKRMLNQAPVYFRDESGRIRSLSRSDFRAAAREGRVTPETPVFDTTLTELGAYRAGRLELPARESWHGGVFFGT